MVNFRKISIARVATTKEAISQFVELMGCYNGYCPFNRLDRLKFGPLSMKKLEKWLLIKIVIFRGQHYPY